MTIQFEGDRAVFAKALVAAQMAYEGAAKAGENPAFRSKYITLDALLLAIKPALNANGIALIQAPGFDGEMVTVETMLVHESGATLSSTFAMRPSKFDPQGLGSCSTYCKRYSLQAMCGVNAEVDDDGNAASGEPQPARKSAAQAKKDGDWDRIIARIDACQTEVALDNWWDQMDPHWGKLPAAWKDAALNEVEKRRNAILDAMAMA
jgi:hypothetical protein